MTCTVGCLAEKIGQKINSSDPKYIFLNVECAAYICNVAVDIYIFFVRKLVVCSNAAEVIFVFCFETGSNVFVLSDSSHKLS